MWDWGLCWREGSTEGGIIIGTPNAWNNCILNYLVSNIVIIQVRKSVNGVALSQARHPIQNWSTMGNSDRLRLRREAPSAQKPHQEPNIRFIGPEICPLYNTDLELGDFWEQEEASRPSLWCSDQGCSTPSLLPSMCLSPVIPCVSLCLCCSLRSHPHITNILFPDSTWRPLAWLEFGGTMCLWIRGGPSPHQMPPSG